MNEEIKQWELFFNINEHRAELNKKCDELEEILSIDQSIADFWSQIFGGEKEFFDRYISSQNWWKDAGIPNNSTKIDILYKLQQLDPEIVEQWVLAFEDINKFYRRMLRKNTTSMKSRDIIALFCDKDDLKGMLFREERWDYSWL